MILGARYLHDLCDSRVRFDTPKLVLLLTALTSGSLTAAIIPSSFCRLHHAIFSRRDIYSSTYAFARARVCMLEISSGEVAPLKHSAYFTVLTYGRPLAKFPFVECTSNRKGHFVQKIVQVINLWWKTS